MIYPENFEEKTGFIHIRKWLKELCLSSLGADRVDEMHFINDYDNLNIMLEQVHEFKQICMFEDNFPIDHFYDPRNSLKKIKVAGTYLEENEIFNIGRSLETVKQILFFFKTHHERYPELTNLCKKINVYPYIIQRIQSILTSNGKLKDNASPGLKEVRNSIKSKENEVTRKIHHIFKKVQSSGWIDKDAGVTIRDGRPVIPVNATNKRMIKGYIHDESSTGKTVYIEPAEVIELNNELRELGYAEKREIIKVLIAFTDDIRPYIEDLAYSYDFLKEIDFIRAKALFAIKVPAVKPLLHNKSYISWYKAFHPVLFLAHKAENKKVVPLDIKLDESNRILIISGPNAGGKSVCLKTVGTVQYMIQCGMLAPVDNNSEAGIFENIFIDIGDEQSIENDLSTYSSHLLNMKYFLKNSEVKSLLLIDEFGTGTEPNIGGAIAEALLQQFNNKKAFGVITTHYSNLKHFAASADGIVNGAMLYDTQKMEPLFILDIGRPGSSFAFEIARSIGIPEDVLQNASAKIGDKHVEFDKHLREILREKRYWERKRTNIRNIEKQLEKKEEKLTSELEKIDTLRKDILNKTRQEADNIIFGLNRKIENTIRAIKESGAEKEKTREVRKELNDFTKKISNKLDDPDSPIHKSLKHINKHQKSEIEKQAILEEGCKVRMKGQDLPGEVLEINKNSIMVSFGNLITTTQPDNLDLITEKEFNKYVKLDKKVSNSRKEIYHKKLNFKPDIDLRGKRAEEALIELNTFLDDAIMVNARELRILHGKGNGILKEVIRNYLHTLDFVVSIHDEHVEHGGAGITIVELEY